MKLSITSNGTLWLNIGCLYIFSSSIHYFKRGIHNGTFIVKWHNKLFRVGR